MLFDKRWDKPEVKVHSFSLVGLVAWLETKNPDETYEWAGCTPCLIEQYGTFAGVKNVFAPIDPGNYETTPYYVLSTSNHQLAAQKPHTFGAALERTRKALCPQENNS